MSVTLKQKQAKSESLSYVTDMLRELQHIAKPHDEFLGYLIEVAYLEAHALTAANAAARAA